MAMLKLPWSPRVRRPSPRRKLTLTLLTITMTPKKALTAKYVRDCNASALKDGPSRWLRGKVLLLSYHLFAHVDHCRPITVDGIRHPLARRAPLPAPLTLCLRLDLDQVIPRHRCPLARPLHALFTTHNVSWPSHLPGPRSRSAARPQIAHRPRITTGIGKTIKSAEKIYQPQKQVVT